jgi:hypothetical protein
LSLPVAQEPHGASADVGRVIIVNDSAAIRASTARAFDGQGDLKKAGSHEA